MVSFAHIALGRRRTYRGGLIVFSLSAVVLLVGGCTLPQPTTNQSTTNANATTKTNTTSVVDDAMTDSTLAMVLLTSSDMASVIDDVRPATIELNDHLDKDYLQNYLFFVGRRWYERAGGTQVIYNAITKYPTTAVAQQETERLVVEYPLIDGNYFGDTTFIAYDDPLIYYGGPSDPAHLYYRFTYGPYSVKVEVVDTGFVGDDASEIQARLLKIAEPLAQRQYQKLADLLAAPTTETPTNTALEHLPRAVDGLTLIGTVPVTAEEWLGVSYDMTADDIPGFVSGGMNRFSIDAQSDHVAEIAVLEFDTPERAQAFQKELLTTGAAAANGSELDLPDSIAATADAMEQDTLTEAQAFAGNYVIDVTVFTPFTDINLGVAREQVKIISDQVFTTFNSSN